MKSPFYATGNSNKQSSNFQPKFKFAMASTLLATIMAVTTSVSTSTLAAETTETFIPGSSLTVPTRYMRPELENVPVDQLIENLTKQIEEKPEDSTLHMNLARVYGMAYAKKSDELEINKRTPDLPWFGYEPQNVPFGSIEEAKDEEAKTLASENLKKSIECFEKAIELDDENLTAKLGLAWSLDQQGKELHCQEMYREIIKVGWEKEKDKTRGGLGFRSIVAEAAGYLIPKLDKEDSAEEIADLNAKVKKVSEIQRPVTPIAIPLGQDHSLESIVNTQASVKFDLDGSGHKKSWQWINKDVGWLVYDQTGEQKIESGLQLFGNVTFWCFWDHGYQPMKTLDNNSDGFLSGGELRHFAIWQDKNSNGVSDAGEVNSLQHHKIVRLSCDSSKHKRSNVMWSPQGVYFSDGSTVPTFDIVLKPAK